jgi:hypothetical protein
MFAPKVVGPQTKAAASSTNSLAPRRSAPAAHRPGHDTVEQLQRTIGNQASLRILSQRARNLTENELHDRNKQQSDAASVTTDQESLHGVSWDFSKIPMILPDRARQPQARSRLDAPPVSGIIQPKLVVGEANGLLEQEADRIAEQVMRTPDPELSGIRVHPQVSRRCSACEKEEAEGTIQPNQVAPPKADITEAPDIVSEVVRSTGQPLDTASRAFFDSRFGYDFSRVRVHTDSQAAEAVRTVGALAFTVSNHIVFGDVSRPHQASQYGLLAHELAHVVQQGGAKAIGGEAADITTEAEMATGGVKHSPTSLSEVATPQVQRQSDASSDLSMPAFPCTQDGGNVLCNFTTDHRSAPNYMDCISKAVTDWCSPGDDDDCSAQSKCAACECLGERYCRCTGIV